MESIANENFKDFIDNLKIDNIKAKESLRAIAFAAWRPETSPQVLQSFLSTYDVIKKDSSRQFWTVFESVLIEEDNVNILLGLIELYLYLDAYISIEDVYSNKIREVLYRIFATSNDKGIQYQVFGYLLNFDVYKNNLLEAVEKHKDKYINLLDTAKRIRMVDDFMGVFNDMFSTWSKDSDRKTIQFFIVFFSEYAIYTPHIASKVRAYYRNIENKVKLNEFFYNILSVNKDFNSKEVLELVLSIYQAEDLINEMVAQFKDFVQFSEEAATKVDDEDINDLSLEICNISGYIEVASAYTHELKKAASTNRKNDIDLVEILKKKKRDTIVDTMAARKDIILNYEDLIKINDIYRIVKNSNMKYNDKIKSHLTYNAADIRSFFKINETNTNLFDAIEEFGIHLYFEDFLNSEFTGCLFRFPILRKAAIVVNKNLTGGRLYFTIAHELGHLVQSTSNSEYLSFSYKESEDNCDKFASELLLPEKYVKPLIQRCDLDFRLINKIATQFNTSIEATLNRCIDLSLDKYVSIVYVDYKKKYMHYSQDNIKEFIDMEIKERLDDDTFAYEVSKNIRDYKDKLISSKIKENADLWIDKLEYNFTINSQVYVQHAESKSIIVLLQFYNRELF